MDIVRIILSGYGCEISRGIITKEEHMRMEKSNSLDNIWVKGLYKYLGRRWQKINLQEDYGITQGDIVITVNDEDVLDVPITVLDTINKDLVINEDYKYPKTTDVVMTTVQKLSGKIADIMFMTYDKFDMDKLKFIRKDIHNEDNECIIDSLISEVYYDGQPIEFGGSETDLRMSNIYFDKK
tara:strand:- start:97 stop:642 length:546 start_codon:yes stop_codon:yes gene_type:complete